MNNDNMTPEFAWFLGYLFSDGSVKDSSGDGIFNFLCKYDDRELMYKVKEILQSKNTVHEHPEYNRPRAQLRVSDKKELWQQYQNIKTVIPVQDIKGYERHFIRGAWDGDGTLSIRKRYETFRMSFTDDIPGTAQWIADHLTNTLDLNHKEARWSPQNNTYEIQWEGITARLIAWYLYHGNINHCSLSRKLQRYKDFILHNQVFTEPWQEMLYSVKGYIDFSGEIAFSLPGLQTLEWCQRLQKLLPFNTVPVFHNKGKRKYYHLYIPQHTINTQDLN